MSLTQHEIVKKLGISRGTLHRILAGSSLVKASTRERVLRELKGLDYVPNVIAQGLKTRRTKSLGVIGPAAANISNAGKLSSLYVAARERGYTIIFGYSDGSIAGDTTSIRELRARMVDGIIAFGRGLSKPTAIYKKLVDDKVPFVSLYPTPGLDADCIYVDTRKAFRTLTEHLIGLGHVDIGLVTNASPSGFIKNRELGFRDAMARARLRVREEWIAYASPEGNFADEMDKEEKIWEASNYQNGFWGASKILAERKRPTALICMTDETAIGALRAADLAGISVPQDLAITGYNDHESAKFARVPLTTMHQPDDLMGREVISLLVKRIENKLPRKPITRAFRAELVIRESSGGPIKKKPAPRKAASN